MAETQRGSGRSLEPGPKDAAQFRNISSVQRPAKAELAACSVFGASANLGMEKAAQYRKYAEDCH